MAKGQRWKRYVDHVIDIRKLENIQDIPQWWARGMGAAVDYQVRGVRYKVFQKQVALMRMFGAKDMGELQEIMFAYSPVLLNLYREHSPIYTGTLYYSGTIDILEEVGQTIMTLYVDPGAYNAVTSGRPSDYVVDLEEQGRGPFGNILKDNRFRQIKGQLARSLIKAVKDLF